MKASVYSIEGQALRQIELPEAFNEEIDFNLIKRAVLAIRSAKRKSYGANPRAGRNNTAIYVGARHYPTPMRTINTGRARKPRLQNRRYLLYGRVAGIAGVVSGPKAHPAKAEKQLREKINKKEKRKATRSALAATAVKELVKKRGHYFDEAKTKELPIIVEEKFESLKKAKEVAKAFENLGIMQDIERAREKRQKRAGKGKRRGRRYKKRKSILVIVSKPKVPVIKAVRNFEGVDVVPAKLVNAELLAPGARAGRLSIITEPALKEL
nr:50S ribosomal protein L4P [uncultured archaeon]